MENSKKYQKSMDDMNKNEKNNDSLLICSLRVPKYNKLVSSKIKFYESLYNEQEMSKKIDRKSVV